MVNLTLVASWLRFLIVFLLAMGILFRFVHLEGKVYSHDEIYTSLRISGYTVAEVKQQLFNGGVISQGSFARFQFPNLERGFSDTIMSLVTEDPQHPPLYYLIARLWVQTFGNSVTVIRSLSALISLLVFPSIYWLCRELFNVQFLVPGLAIALMAISPIHVLYAQEAQSYILWLVTILLCSASLLRAMRLESQSHDESVKFQEMPDPFATWGIYVLSLVVSLYTSLWSVFLALTQGIYVITINRFQLTETVRAYLLASSLGFLAFMPWMTIVVANLLEFIISADVTENDRYMLDWQPILFIQISRVFFDLNIALENPIQYLISLIFMFLAAYTLYFICRTTNYKTWLFMVTLIIVPFIPLMLPNLFPRSLFYNSIIYLVPVYLSIQVSVAYTLATQIYSGISSRRRIWQVILGLIIVLGMVSCRVRYEGETWWNKGISYGNPEVAEILNEAQKPLVISNSQGINYVTVFSLSYLVTPKVRFQLVRGEDIPNIPDGFKDIFLLNPSDTWRRKIETRYKSTANVVYRNNYHLLWKLTHLR
jgi:uncharacterized membrane protein